MATLFDTTPPVASPKIDGATYDPKLDGKRLGTQGERVKQLMLDGKRRTLPEIADALGVETITTGLSARVRDLRKPEFGGYIVKRARRTPGLWEYWVEVQP